MISLYPVVHTAYPQLIFFDIFLGRGGEKPVRNLVPAQTVTHLQEPDSVVRNWIARLEFSATCSLFF